MKKFKVFGILGLIGGLLAFLGIRLARKKKKTPQ